MAAQFVIRDITHDWPGEHYLYWSNEHGWVDLASATRFTAEEVIEHGLRLPLGYSPVWVNVWGDK